MAHGLSRTQLETSLAKWMEAQVISPEQAGKIRELEAPDKDAPFREPAQVLTWLGGFLALIAATVFVGVDWDNMGPAQQTLWATVAVGGLWTLAWILRREINPLRLQASNLLLIVGTLAIMLLAYALYRLTGLWPDHPDQGESMRRTNVLMGYAQAITALAAVFWAFRLRVSWMLLPAGVVGWLAWLTWMDTYRSGPQTDAHFLRMSIYGVVLVIVGMIIAPRGWKHHATWLLIIGLTLNLVMLGVTSFENPLGLNGLVFLALTLIAIALGIVTEFRIFLIYGAIGLYGWLSAIVIETFGGSRPVALALILIGVMMVAAGTLWQRRHALSPLQSA